MSKYNKYYNYLGLNIATEEEETTNVENTKINKEDVENTQLVTQPVSSPQSPTIIISAMVLTGKSTWSASNEYVKDLDSSMYSKKPDGTRSDEFPSNYIEAIKWQLNNCNWKYLLISSSKEVRDILKKENIKFYTFYPSLSRKEEIIKLAIDRGNDANFITLLRENYDNWINDMSQEHNSHELGDNEFLSDELFETKFKYLKQ